MALVLVLDIVLISFRSFVFDFRFSALAGHLARVVSCLASRRWQRPVGCAVNCLAGKATSQLCPALLLPLCSAGALASWLGFGPRYRELEFVYVNSPSACALDGLFSRALARVPSSRRAAYGWEEWDFGRCFWTWSVSRWRRGQVSGY